MSKSATRAKSKYNAKTYTKLYISMKKKPCEEFKAKCKERGVTYSEVLRIGIREFMGWDDDVDI